jgi:hypothetical protein
MRILAVLFVTGLISHAGLVPVGSVSSSSPFELRGNRIAVAGVPSWPVAAGDEIATDASAATIRFRDGSEATLDKYSRAKIEQDGSNLVLQLKGGSLQYTVAKGSVLHIRNLNHEIPVQPGVVRTITTKPGLTPVIRPVTAGFTLPSISGSR